MKKLNLTLLCLCILSLSNAQKKEEVIEKRLRELHVVLSIDDPAKWESYIKENYTPSYIERRGLDNIKGVYKKVADNWSQSKVISFGEVGEQYELIIRRNDDAQKLQYLMTPEKDKPWRIDALAFEVGNVQRQGPGKAEKVVVGPEKKKNEPEKKIN